MAAGPGDPGLITVRGRELLARCDVVLYDALANPALLRHIAPTAEQICVGKHGSQRIWQQSEILAEIDRQAALGKSIVRLKGGDTAIFARTGEEIDFLLAAGIRFEVVPGVTSASAASAYAGIPLTHRDWSSAVAFVTGHQQATDGAPEAEDELDWQELARFPGTLVLYMAVTNVAKWSSAFLAAGKPPSTPVALVRHASLPHQRVWKTTLADVASLVQGKPKLRPPIIFIVGPVAGLSDDMNWFAQKPLSKTTVLLTRPAGSNEALVYELEQLGAMVLVAPAIELSSPDRDSLESQSLGASVENVDCYDWIIFSSARGVEFWINRLFSSGRDVRALAHCKLAGVGPSVRESLKRFGLNCDIVLEDDCNAEHLCATLKTLVAGKRVLNVTTNRAKSILGTELAPFSATFESVIAYVSHPTSTLDPSIVDQLRSGHEIFVTATSVAIAEAAWQYLQPLNLHVHWLALSNDIAASLRGNGAQSVEIIGAISGDAIQEAILRFQSDATQDD